MTELRKQGYTPHIRAMVWQQGEADARFDAGEQNTQNYAANLKNFIEQVRIDVKEPSLIFVYGEVMPLAASRFTGREVVRKAQKLVSTASASAFSMQNAYIIPCDDLQMRSSDFRSPHPTDDVHFGTFGILTLGERYANTIFSLITK